MVLRANNKINTTQGKSAQPSSAIIRKAPSGLFGLVDEEFSLEKSTVCACSQSTQQLTWSNIGMSFWKPHDRRGVLIEFFRHMNCEESTEFVQIFL